jgi:UDP-N-acetylmuramate dehydrogenase
LIQLLEKKLMQANIFNELRSTFYDRLQENVPLSGYTVARLGGPADLLIIVRSAEELVLVAEKLWEADIPFVLLGGGSNVLVSDKGVRNVVIINRSRRVKFSVLTDPPTVQAESGVTPNDIAQRAAGLGLAGFEWAASVPGSLGGAIYGNAGAFDSDMAGNLISIELMHRHQGRRIWTVGMMEYGYRTSVLKREHPPALILSAQLALSHGDPQAIREKMELFSKRRKNSQPAGASMGSVFKNPPGDKAGRLIEAAGLKGKRIGDVEISAQHANFFINHGQSTAQDYRTLIELARSTVAEKFGLTLDLEVELIGEW